MFSSLGNLKLFLYKNILGRRWSGGEKTVQFRLSPILLQDTLTLESCTLFWGALFKLWSTLLIKYIYIYTLAMVPSSSDGKSCWISFHPLSQVTQFPSLEKSYLTSFSCIFPEYASNLRCALCMFGFVFIPQCTLGIASYPWRTSSFFLYCYIVFHLINLCSWSPLDEHLDNLLLLCSYKQCCNKSVRTLFHVRGRPSEEINS